MTRAAAVDRARKLLAVAASNPGHEANIARVRARELKRKFRLTEDEITPKEAACTVVDDKPGPWRELLAFAVAFSRGCTARKPGAFIAISGERRAHDSALELYRSLCQKAETSCVPTISGGIVDANPHIKKLISDVWQERFCEGFANMLGQRLVTATIADKKPSPEPVEEAPPSSEGSHQARTQSAEETLLKQGLELADELAKVMTVGQAMATAHQVYEMSYAQGIQLAQSTPCTAWTPRAPDYTLRSLAPASLL